LICVAWWEREQSASCCARRKGGLILAFLLFSSHGTGGFEKGWWLARGSARTAGWRRPCGWPCDPVARCLPRYAWYLLRVCVCVARLGSCRWCDGDGHDRSRSRGDCHDEGDSFGCAGNPMTGFVGDGIKSGRGVFYLVADATPRTSLLAVPYAGPLVCRFLHMYIRTAHPAQDIM